MDNLDTLTKVTWFVGTLLTLALALRLWWSGLISSYTAFFVYLCFTVLRDIFLWTVPLKRMWYGDFYMASQGLVGLMFALVVLEIYALVLASYPAIKTFSRWVAAATVGLSAVIWGALTYIDVTSRQKPSTLDLFYSVERGLYSALVMLIVVAGLFLFWFPVKLPKNVIAHSAIFAGFFLSKAAVLLLRSVLSAPYYKTLNVVLFGVTYCALVLWIAFFKSAGQKVDVTVGHQWNPADEGKLLGQLQSINTALARAGHQ